MKNLIRVLLFISIEHSLHSFEITVIKADTIQETMRAQLTELFVTTFSRAYEHVDVETITTNSNTMKDYLVELFSLDCLFMQNQGFNFIVITEEQLPVGYSLACYCEEENKVYIHHLVVDSKSQGKGIGRMLLAASQNLYPQADFITLSTRTFNEKAIGFYKYLGFYETEKTPKIAYILRPNAKNNPHIVCLEKKIRE